MNKVFLKGNLVKDIEVRTTPSETKVGRFIVATKRNVKNKDGNYDSDFINCIAFDNHAEFIKKYFNKGSGILLEGNIRTGSYERNGEKVYTTDVVVEKVEFVDKQQQSDPYADMGNKVANEQPY